MNVIGLITELVFKPKVYVPG